MPCLHHPARCVPCPAPHLLIPALALPPPTGDALQPAASGGLAQALALHLLGALVGADDAGGLASEVHRSGIPRALLESVSATATKVLLQPSYKAKVRSPGGRL